MKNIILQRIKDENYAFRPYGTCATAAGTQEKIVNITCPDKTDNSIVFSLLEGSTVLVEFQNANSTANATLNVNNTGAKPIFYNGVALTETWQSRELVEFFYDGTNWNVLNTLSTVSGGGGISEIPVATSEVLGGIKVGSVNGSAATIQKAGTQNYAVNVDSNDLAYVSLPVIPTNAVTAVTINGTTIQPTNGVVDLGTVSGDSEDNDTKNTVGATSIPSTTNGRIVLTNGNIGSEYAQSYVYQGCQFFTNGTSDLIQFGGSSVGGDYGNRDVSMTVNGTMQCKSLIVGGNSLSGDTFVLNAATSDELGGIKVGYTTNETNKNYAVQLENEKAYVNVPWTDLNVKTDSAPGVNYYLCGSTSSNSSATGESLVKKSTVYVGYSNNAVYASGGFFESSDERLKNFTERIPVDLDRLSELKKNYFTWKDSENTEQQLGVSAQEIRELYPEIVSEQENGTLTVAYDKLSVIALAAIDELHKKNKELEERLSALENKLK